jgi:hypothetical protein
MLCWEHPQKPARLFTLAQHLAEGQVDTEEQLARWLSLSENCNALARISGIGPKTIDYLKVLSGSSAVAVDRHIRTVAVAAGVSNTSYVHVQKVIAFAADFLGVSRVSLDASLWTHLSQKARPQHGDRDAQHQRHRRAERVAPFGAPIWPLKSPL